MIEGIEPSLRFVAPAGDSALLAVLIGLIALNLLLAPTLIRSAMVLFKQLFSTRRETLPGERTFTERIVMTCAVGQTIVFEALMLYCLCGADETPALASLGGLCLLTLMLFLVQTVGYALTGYAFSNGDNTHAWLSTFFISQAVTGFPLALTALCSLFYPRFSGLLFICGSIVYILGRIPLYIREFRIFYTMPASLFYFFLYLCTLEIAPLIGVLAFSGLFSTLFC